MRYWRRSGRGSGWRVRQRLVDARAVEIAAAQHLGKQAHLAAGAAAFALDAGGGQRGFLAGQGDEIIAQRLELVGDGFKEFRRGVRPTDCETTGNAALAAATAVSTSARVA